MKYNDGNLIFSAVKAPQSLCTVIWDTCLLSVGAGYQMTLVKKSTCDTDAITSTVQSHVVGARLNSDVSAELSYVLPHDSKTNFSQLFSHIDEHKEELGVVSYGVSVTTMDEVFIRLLTLCWCAVVCCCDC